MWSLLKKRVVGGINSIVDTVITDSYKKRVCGIYDPPTHIERRLGQHGRQLGRQELLFHRSNLLNHMLTSEVLFVDADVELEEAIVRKAIDKLMARYPELRMVVMSFYPNGEDKDDVKYYVEPMKKVSSYDVLEMSDQSNSDWEEDMEKDIVKSFKDEDLLWRVKMYKPTAVDWKFRHAFLVTLEHGIADGHGFMYINIDFVHYLDDLLNGEDKVVESLPRLPPAEVIAEAKILPPITDLIKMHHSECSVHPSPNAHEALSSVLRERFADRESKPAPKLMYFTLNAKELSALKKACRDHNATIGGATTVAAALGIKRLMEKYNIFPDCSKEQLEMPYLFLASLRRYFDHPNANIGLGNFATNCPNHICLAPVGKTDEFWNLAANDTVSVRERVKDNGFCKLYTDHYYHDCSHTQTGARQFCKCKYMLYPMFVSNRGAFTCSPDDGTPRKVKFSGTFYHNSCQEFNMCWLGHNITTVDGVLYWNLDYSPHRISDKHALEYKNIVEGILKDMAK